MPSRRRSWSWHPGPARSGGGSALAGWLLGVARRVALRSRADLARRRVSEGRAAEMRARREEDRPESWPELHEEIGRLPGRYREPVVLCYLEGLSTDAAALRLGCPKGTVLSRLSRARERLRGRLIRRGLAPPKVLLTTGKSPEGVPVAIPPGLLTATVRASLRFAERPASAVPVASIKAIALARKVLYAMMISKLKILGAATLACVFALGGLQTYAVQFGGVGGAPGPALPGPQARADDRQQALSRSMAKIQGDLAESARINAELQRELNDLRAELESLRRPAVPPAPSQVILPASSPASAPNSGAPPGSFMEDYMGEVGAKVRPRYIQTGQLIVVSSSEGDTVTAYSTETGKASPSVWSKPGTPSLRCCPSSARGSRRSL